MWLSFSIVLQCCLVTAFAGVLNRRVNLVPTVDSTVIELSATDTGVYPRLANLSDGSFLACYTVVGDGTKTLTVSKSTDGANTFSRWERLLSLQAIWTTVTCSSSPTGTL